MVKKIAAFAAFIFAGLGPNVAYSSWPTVGGLSLGASHTHFNLTEHFGKEALLVERDSSYNTVHFETLLLHSGGLMWTTGFRLSSEIHEHPEFGKLMPKGFDTNLGWGFKIGESLLGYLLGGLYAETWSSSDVRWDYYNHSHWNRGTQLTLGVGMPTSSGLVHAWVRLQDAGKTAEHYKNLHNEVIDVPVQGVELTMITVGLTYSFILLR